MSHFNIDSPFDIRVLSLLEPAPVMSTLSHYTQRIQSFLGLTTISNADPKSLLKYWIDNVQQIHIPPTWKNLLLIIRLLNLDGLAQQMEAYLSGATEELSHTGGTDGGGNVPA